MSTLQSVMTTLLLPSALILGIAGAMVAKRWRSLAVSGGEFHRHYRRLLLWIGGMVGVVCFDVAWVVQIRGDRPPAPQNVVLLVSAVLALLHFLLYPRIQLRATGDRDQGVDRLYRYLYSGMLLAEGVAIYLISWCAAVLLYTLDDLV